MITIVPGNIIFGNQGSGKEFSIKNQSFYLVKTDLRGNFTSLNALFCSTMAINAGDWLGKNALRFIHKDDYFVLRAAAKQLDNLPDQAQKVILRQQTASGLLSIQWDLMIISDENKSPLEVLCIGYDITSLVKKQDDLQLLLNLTRSQNKRLKEFTYIVSHNIRSHVANLSGIVHTLDLEDKEDVAFSVDLLKISVGALDHTIHYLNEIVSIQENKELPLKTIDVNAEIDKTEQILHAKIIDSDVTIISEIAEGTKLHTNPAYFESILLNLLSNAIKYRSNHRKPQIKLTLNTQGDYEVLAIKDNGIGLDLDKMRDRLFGIFNTFNNNKDATGMGLYITKTEIEAMGGKIDVESQPGFGSTFFVYFPTKIQ